MNNYIITYDPYRGTHLEHRSHKYISRKWKDGHWVYTYPKGLTYSDSARIKELKSAYENANYLANYARKAANKETVPILKSDREAHAKYFGKEAMAAKDQAHQIQAAAASYNRKKVQNEIKKWESTPLSKLQTAFYKAVDKVNSFVNKIKTSGLEISAKGNYSTSSTKNVSAYIKVKLGGKK